MYVTSCVSSSTSHSSGSILPFPNKKTSSGISRLSSFLSSGTFTAEETGVYTISATIYTRTRSSYFYIYKDSSLLTRTYVGTWYTDTYYTTATGVVTVELNVGNTLTVRTGPSMYVYSTYSCVSIVKIK